MVRLDMGLLEKEVFHATTRNESDLGGGYCKLQLPAPVLQWELTTEQKPVKYYFGTQLTLFQNPENHDESTDYFLCFGDQIDTVVFICAIYVAGDSIPSHFLCMDEIDFKQWLFPKEGEESQEPTYQSWGLYDSVEFCRENMYNGHNLTVHLDDSAKFGETIVIVITHLAKVKPVEQYSFIFNFELHDGCGANEDLSLDDNADATAKLTPAQKAALTKAANKNKSKGRHLPSRGGGPKVNVLALLANAHQQSASDGANKKSVSKGSRGTSQKQNQKKKKETPMDKSANKQIQILEKEREQWQKEREKERQTWEKEKAKELEKLGKKATQNKSNGPDVHRTDPSLSAIAGDIVAALTSVVGTITSASSTSQPVMVTSKKEQLDDDEATYDLHHRKRMKDLNFMEAVTKLYGNMPNVGQQPQQQQSPQIYPSPNLQQQGFNHQPSYLQSQSVPCSVQQQSNTPLQFPQFTPLLSSPYGYQQQQQQPQTPLFQQQTPTAPFQQIQQTPQQSQFQQQQQTLTTPFQQQVQQQPMQVQQMQQAQQMQQQMQQMQQQMQQQQHMPTAPFQQQSQFQQQQQTPTSTSFQQQVQQQPMQAQQMQQQPQTSLFQQQTPTAPFQQIQQTPQQQHMPTAPFQQQSQFQQQQQTLTTPFQQQVQQQPMQAQQMLQQQVQSSFCGMQPPSNQLQMPIIQGSIANPPVFQQTGCYEQPQQFVQQPMSATSSHQQLSGQPSAVLQGTVTDGKQAEWESSQLQVVQSTTKMVQIPY